MAAIILDKDEEPKREDTPTYAIGVKGSYLIVRVESYEYDELKEWYVDENDISSECNTDRAVYYDKYVLVV